MKIVCTGALGHIGSSLIRKLPIELDCELVIIDNFHTQRYYSLFDLSRRVRFVQGDILSYDLEKEFSGADVVIHLAAITDAESSFSNKEIVERVNVEGTERVARACSKLGCKLIYASTTSVYGVSEGEVDETSEVKPQSPYAESKIKTEGIIAQVAQEGYLDYIILRMGTIFGISPGMRFHTAVNKFCFQASCGKDITVWRTAMSQNRPYLDLHDMVRATNFIIENNIFTNEAYNLVTVNTTVGEIIKIISRIVPTLNITYVDSPIMNQLSYTVSPKRFEKLGFRFEGSIQRGIEDTLNLLEGVAR